MILLSTKNIYQIINVILNKETPLYIVFVSLLFKIFLFNVLSCLINIFSESSNKFAKGLKLKAQEMISGI